jgi:hypothetical protein
LCAFTGMAKGGHSFVEAGFIGDERGFDLHERCARIDCTAVAVSRVEPGWRGPRRVHWPDRPAERPMSLPRAERDNLFVHALFRAAAAAEAAKR